MSERKSVTEATAWRYRRSGKKGKGLILDEFVQVTGYNRAYARHVLRATGKKVYAGATRSDVCRASGSSGGATPGV